MHVQGSTWSFFFTSSTPLAASSWWFKILFVYRDGESGGIKAKLQTGLCKQQKGPTTKKPEVFAPCVSYLLLCALTSGPLHVPLRLFLPVSMVLFSLEFCLFIVFPCPLPCVFFFSVLCVLLFSCACVPFPSCPVSCIVLCHECAVSCQCVPPSLGPSFVTYFLVLASFLPFVLLPIGEKLNAVHPRVVLQPNVTKDQIREQTDSL